LTSGGLVRKARTILVCPGEYNETVKVTKAHLTIKGAKAGHDATRRGRQRESVVTHIDPEGTVQLLADDIRWDGFTIQGVFGERPRLPGPVQRQRHGRDRQHLAEEPGRQRRASGHLHPPTGNEPPPHHGGGHGHGKPKKHRDPCKCTRNWRF
jgi:hypothetical protein